MSKKLTKTQILVESAILIAVATVLSMIKLAEMPYGGSVTVASLLPIVIISYRHGLLWGLGSGFVFGVVQQLLGLNNLQWAPTWKAVLAVILLDYIIAFTVIGLGGMFRKMEKQNVALAVGSFVVCILRYICHVIVGATVWAGLSIPSKAALLYSLAYNAAYMIPEAIVLVAVGYYLGSMIDLRRETPSKMERDETGLSTMVKLECGLVLVGMTIYDIATIFSKLQNEETGFSWQGLKDVEWVKIIVISSVCIIAAVALWLYGKKKEKDSTQK